MAGHTRCTATIVALCLATPCWAEGADEHKALEISGGYTADVMHVSGKGIQDDLYWLDNLDIIADVDLDQLAGLNGTTVHVHLLNNLGGMPNNAAGTLQGVDNIEVGSQRFRIFEAWVEHAIGARTTVRAGLYDLNSEFYANDAAGTLLAPAFGVGSEISATGPNGPSIFPSTALAVRVHHTFGKNGYIRAAALNANARTIGDPRGVDFHFDNGLLLAAESGVEGDLKAALGAWTYTKRQDDIIDVDASGQPRKRTSRGAYALFEHPLNHVDGPGQASAFLRVGISDSHTTPFRGGWQAGVTVAGPIASRPDGVLSIGANQALLSRGFRDLQRNAGIATSAAETAFEITYADKLFGRVGIQPDFQIVLNPGGERGRGPALVFGTRFSIEF